MKIKIKSCPFCGAEIETPKPCNLQYSPIDEYAIQCPICYAWGPEAKTTIGAIEAWNRRDEK